MFKEELFKYGHDDKQRLVLDIANLYGYKTSDSGGSDLPLDKLPDIIEALSQPAPRPSKVNEDQLKQLGLKENEFEDNFFLGGDETMVVPANAGYPNILEQSKQEDISPSWINDDMKGGAVMPTPSKNSNILPANVGVSLTNGVYS